MLQLGPGALARERYRQQAAATFRETASIRPGRFGPGEPNMAAPCCSIASDASIRPGRFGPGEGAVLADNAALARVASIRPGRFGPGEATSLRTSQTKPRPSFN